MKAARSSALGHAIVTPVIIITAKLGFDAPPIDQGPQ